MYQIARRLLKSPTIWQVALSVYWVTLFVATHLPSAAPMVPGRGGDKLVHLVAFAILALLLATTWQLSSGWLTGVHFRWAWLVVTLYGVVDELTQPYFGRHASVGDVIANALGAVVGLVLFAILRRAICSAATMRDGPE